MKCTILVHYSCTCATRAKSRKSWHTEHAHPRARFCCDALACLSHCMHACICTGDALSFCLCNWNVQKDSGSFVGAHFSGRANKLAARYTRTMRSRGRILVS
eukprot:1979146-Pleurochrysis_carterae.AAC.2